MQKIIDDLLNVRNALSEICGENETMRGLITRIDGTLADLGILQKSIAPLARKVAILADIAIGVVPRRQG